MVTRFVPFDEALSLSPGIPMLFVTPLLLMVVRKNLPPNVFLKWNCHAMIVSPESANSILGKRTAKGMQRTLEFAGRSALQIFSSRR